MAMGEWGAGLKGSGRGSCPTWAQFCFLWGFFLPEPDPNPAFVPVTRQIPGPAGLSHRVEADGLNPAPFAPQNYPHQRETGSGEIMRPDN